MPRQKQFPTTSAAALVAASMIALSASLTTVQAQQKVMIVLDSSGSMAGKIGGMRKIDIAKQAVGNILGAIDPKTRLGLFAYGHRRKGDCSDIQQIHTIGAPNYSTMMQAVNRLRPVGKTPLSDAVRLAAEELKFTEDKASVILVSDGKETCGSDPCALGRQLKAQGIDFKVHVVGFNIKRGEESGLQCLARNTGGIYVAANNANALTMALAQTVKKVEVETKPAPKPQADTIQGLKVRIFAKQGGPELKDRASFAIFGKPQGLEGKRPRINNVLNKSSGHVFKGLKSGEYQLVTTLWNHSHIRQITNFKIDGGANTLDVVLNIGQVRFDVTYKQGGRLYEKTMSWEVSAPNVDFSGKRKRIANLLNKKNKAVYWMPAGTWRAEGIVWNATHIRTPVNITVLAGGEHVQPVNLNAGLVRFDTRLAPGAPLIDARLSWAVYPDKTGIDGKRKRLVNFLNKPVKEVFMLPAGEWNVEGSLWNHNHLKFKTTLKVEAGGQLPHEVSMNAAKVRLDVTIDGKPTSDAVTFSLREKTADLAGKRKVIATLYNRKPGHVTYFPAGDHELHASLWKDRNVSGSQKVEIKAGNEQVLRVNLTSE